MNVHKISVRKFSYNTRLPRLRKCDNTKVDYRVIIPTFDSNSISKGFLGFKELEFSPPCSLKFPIEPVCESTEQAVCCRYGIL
jgi:hypothetical protein